VNEEEIAKVLGSENEEFRKLKEEHLELETQLAEFDSHVYLTPEEELERKRIQKLKLAKKDRMAELIRDYRAGAAAG
jgi:uncharacterized protein YdcH (DUF465 family)